MTPQRVALMRRVRDLIRDGWSQPEITAATGASTMDIAAQRRWVEIADGDRDGVLGMRARSGKRSRIQHNKQSASEAGDLCDIFRAPPTRRDFRYWMGAE